MLCVVKLNVIMLSVIMLDVVAPFSLCDVSSIQFRGFLLAKKNFFFLLLKPNPGNFRRHGTQRNDIQHNDILHNDAQHKGFLGHTA